MFDALDRLGCDRSRIELGNPLANALDRCFHPVNPGDVG
jgi:hypothetical protein